MYDMYANFLSSELKKWLRDPMMSFMVFYPILFGIVGRFILPLVADTAGFNLEHFTDLVLVILTLMTPHVYGAVIGFSILDDRDDNILSSIKVTPLSIHQFLSFKLVAVFILCFVACVFVMWFSNIGNIHLGAMLALAFLVSLAAPMTGLLINALSQNKIEGFAVMKGLGTIILFPIIAIFFVDKKEFIFAFAPGFWPAKAISTLVRGEGALLLSYNQYYLVGLVYILLLNLATYRLFLRKSEM